MTLEPIVFSTYCRGHQGKIYDLQGVVVLDERGRREALGLCPVCGAELRAKL